MALIKKMTYLFNRLTFKRLAEIHGARYGNKAGHWSIIKKKKTSMDRALQHFDEFYGNVYGKSWEDIRTALLMEDHKYAAIVNSYSDIDRIKSELESQGAINIKTVYGIYKEQIDASPHSNKKSRKEKRHHTASVITDAQSSIVQSYYSEDRPLPTSINAVDEDPDVEQEILSSQSIELKSIEMELNKVELDETRIVEPNSGFSGMYEFVPATKLKGMDDWILESQHYGYYKEGAEFSVKVEEEALLTFPYYLNIYTFERENDTKFPSPKKGSTDVLDYYLMDGASILPVLALDLQPSDVVLDMCAAPGGKTLSILQTLLPSIVVANDVSKNRVDRINSVIYQFLADIGQWHDRLFVTQRDARFIEDKDMFNKILVDVPCTTDRHVLHSDENSIFKPQRIRERLQIPELQSAILTNALKIVAVGGTVVYSTCSLSPIQNDGVVGMALKKAWEETNSIMVVKDMSQALKPLRCLYKFDDYRLKYGHIAIPTVNNNWGPMYFCKITRMR